MLWLLIVAQEVFGANIASVTKDALKFNSEYKSAVEAAMAMQDSLDISKSAWRPQLTLNASKGNNETKPAPNSNDANSVLNLRSTSYGISYNQKVFDLTALHDVSKQNYLLKQAIYTREATKLNVMYEVALAYFSVLEAINSFENEKAKLKAYKQQLTQVEHEYNAGKTAKPKLSQVESQYQLAAAETLAAKNNIIHAVQGLSQLTGVSYKMVKGLGSSFPLKRPVPSNPDAWVKLMLKNNLSLKAEHASVMSKEQEMEAARASRLPVVSFSTGVSRTRPIQTSPAFSTVRQWSVNLVWPLFSGGANISKLSRAEHFASQSQQSLISLRRQLIQQTISSYYDVSVGVDRVRAARSAVKSAEIAKNAINEGYKVGTETITEVLQGISRLYAARLQLIKANYGYLTSVLSLKVLIGALSFNDINSLDKIFVAKPYNVSERALSLLVSSNFNKW